MYKEIITKFINFISIFSEMGDFNSLYEDEDENSLISIEYRKMKCMEYSVYLIL